MEAQPPRCIGNVRTREAQLLDASAWMSRPGFVRINGDRISGLCQLIYKWDILGLQATYKPFKISNFLGHPSGGI